MASLFTRIVQGEIPSWKVAETEKYFAFLDIQPLAEGHTLVIPKKEVDYLFDLDDEEYAGLMLFARIIARGLKKAVPCKRIGMSVIGLEVPHAHIHLVPINDMGDLNFKNPRKSFSPGEYKAIAERIRKEL